MGYDLVIHGPLDAVIVPVSADWKPFYKSRTEARDAQVAYLQTTIQEASRQLAMIATSKSVIVGKLRE